jgi:hypothetical protein
MSLKRSCGANDNRRFKAKQQIDATLAFAFNLANKTKGNHLVKDNLYIT